MREIKAKIYATAGQSRSSISLPDVLNVIFPFAGPSLVWLRLARGASEQKLWTRTSLIFEPSRTCKDVPTFTGKLRSRVLNG